MTVYTENIPGNEMALDMTAEDVARAFEYYMNGVLFKRPITVVGVDKLSAAAVHGGNQFRIRFTPATAIPLEEDGEPEPIYLIETEEGKDVEVVAEEL
jgi:hypothetical protein